MCLSRRGPVGLLAQIKLLHPVGGCQCACRKVDQKFGGHEFRGRVYRRAVANVRCCGGNFVVVVAACCRKKWFFGKRRV